MNQRTKAVTRKLFPMLAIPLVASVGAAGCKRTDAVATTSTLSASAVPVDVAPIAIASASSAPASSPATLPPGLATVAPANGGKLRAIDAAPTRPFDPMADQKLAENEPEIAPGYAIRRVSGEAYFTSQTDVFRRTASGELVPVENVFLPPDPAEPYAERNALVLDVIAPGGHVIALTAQVSTAGTLVGEEGNTAGYTFHRSVETFRVFPQAAKAIARIDDLTLYRKQVVALEGGALVVEPPNPGFVMPTQVRAACGVRIARPADLATSPTGDLEIVGEDCARPGRALVESWTADGTSRGVEEIDLELGRDPSFPEKRLVIEAGGALETLLGLGPTGVRLFVRGASGRFEEEPFVDAGGLLDADVALDGTLYVVVKTKPELAAKCAGASLALVRRAAPGKLTCFAIDRPGRRFVRFGGLFAASARDAYVALTDTAFSLLLAAGPASELAGGSGPAPAVDEVLPPDPTRSP